VQLEDTLIVNGVFTNLGTLIPKGAPAVLGLNPAVGSTYGGTVVTITGTNFTGATQVDFGGISATSFTVESNSSILATAPAQAAGVVDITVTTSVATSATGAVDHYTYQTPNLATYLSADTTTQGSWIGAYGSQGYDVIDDSSSLPGYAGV